MATSSIVNDVKKDESQSTLLTIALCLFGLEPDDYPCILKKFKTNVSPDSGIESDSPQPEPETSQSQKSIWHFLRDLAAKPTKSDLETETSKNTTRKTPKRRKTISSKKHVECTDDNPRSLGANSDEVNKDNEGRAKANDKITYDFNNDTPSSTETVWNFLETVKESNSNEDSDGAASESSSEPASSSSDYHTAGTLSRPETPEDDDNQLKQTPQSLKPYRDILNLEANLREPSWQMIHPEWSDIELETNLTSNSSVSNGTTRNPEKWPMRTCPFCDFQEPSPYLT